MIRTGKTGLLAGLFVIFLLPPAIAAEEPPQSDQPRAVLVGISEYADKQIKPRLHAEDDVKALYDLFTDKQYLGIKPENIRLLTGQPDRKRNSQPATRQNVLDAVEWLARESAIGDLTYFVFIGEGAPLGDKSDRRCYLTSDTVFTKRNRTAVAASDIEDRLQKLKSRHFVAFIDVNFKGYNDRSVLDPVLGASPYREFLGSDGTEENNPQPGRTVFLATSGLSASLDLKEHGLMTHVLLAGLKGEADQEGYEADGSITVAELVAYMSKQMPALAREHGKTDDEKAQVHFALGERNSTTVLTYNPDAIAKTRERLDKLEKLIADKKLADNLAEEARRLLGLMPRLKAQQDLRRAYQQLVDGELTIARLEEKRKAILDSVKLDPKLAEKFADTILNATDVLLSEYVKKVEQGELVNWAVRGLYRRINEQVPGELLERLSGAKKMNKADLKKLLVDARLTLGKREDLDGQKDVDIALQRMMSNLDPYTTYIDPQTVEQFKKGTEGRFVGIGVSIRKDAATDYLLVITPLKGSPAYRAGIRAGDLISKVTLTVDREGNPLDEPEVVATNGLNISEAVRKITGKPGTQVKITIQRPGEDKPIDFDIIRDQIEMETVIGARRKASDDWDFMLDPESKIGYIRLTQFTRHSADEVSRAVRELKDQGLKGLVFDVRFNPGGLLSTAREITDLFIDDGLIVSIKPREGREERLPGFSEGSELKFPMVCLVNGGSASGSEIVAAALQDHGRAIVVGERSFGKGSVQNVKPFGGGEIKLTTASFWRPNGKNLNKSSTRGRDEDEWGVVPDQGFEVKLTGRETDDLEEALREAEVIHPPDAPIKKTNPDFKDRQLEKALDYLREQIKLADKVKSLAGEED